MSAIYGLVSANRAPGSTDLAGAMAAGLAHRGPCVPPLVRKGPALLGSRSRVGAPETVRDDASLSIVFDGRIDNRDEVCASLRLRSRDLSDAALLLSSYRTWGPDCAKRLLGDFAFAIWDEAEQQLFLARDQFGVRPLCYTLDHDGLIFASEPRAILEAKPDLASNQDPAYLADYMAGIAAPADMSLYPAIKRLAPGCHLTFRLGVSRIVRYYVLPVGTPPGAGDAPAAFAETFRAAVSSRMGGPRPVGAMLSGGLDSSSVVSVGAPLAAGLGLGPLKTFSMVYSDYPEGDERPFIDKVVELGHIEPHYLESSSVHPFEGLATLLKQNSGPFFGPNLAASRRLLVFARDHGCSTLMDGHGGDEVVAFGGGRLNDLAFSVKWLQLWAEVSRLCEVEKLDPGPAFMGLLKRFGPHRRLRRRLGDVRRRARGVPTKALPGARYVAPELLNATGFAERHRPDYDESARFGREERHEHYHTLGAPSQPYSLELLDRVSSHDGVELRFPFWDRRLVELSVSLPSHERLHDGYTRSILRRALTNILPDAIRFRPDKLNFGQHVVRGMREGGTQIIADILRDRTGALAHHANLPLLRELWHRCQTDGAGLSGLDIQAIWRATVLGAWLEGRGAL